MFCVYFLIPAFAYAAITPSPAWESSCLITDIDCVPTDLGGFVAKYYTYGLGLIGGVSLIFIIFGSYIVLTSQGNPQQLNNGKSYIGYAIVGLLLAIFGYLLVEVIVKDLLQIPEF